MALLVGMPSRGGILGRLSQILSRAQDLTPLCQPVRDVLWNANRDRSLRGLDWQGKNYVQLAPATLKDRARVGAPPGPPMNRRGLAARIIQDCEIRVFPREGQVRFTKSWPDLPWLEYHITGAGRLPVRDPMGWNPAELRTVAAMLPRHVLGRPTF